MAYVWINPVAERMYEPDILNDFLSYHGYKRFQTSTDWLAIVREKYRFAVSQSEDTVMDMRCPRIGKLLEELELESVTIPDIQPILIHCGKELGEQVDLLGEEKIITTPCQDLADMGNELGIKGTWFVTWNRFLELLGDEPKGTVPDASPIPPGFFEDLDLETISLTGEEEIRKYFADRGSEKVQLVEMLFCKEGCHNGDGIRKCEA